MSLNTTALVSNPSWRSFSVTRQPTSPLTVTTSRIRNVSPSSAETETSHCSASVPSRSDSLAGPGVSPASSSRWRTKLDHCSSSVPVSRSTASTTTVAAPVGGANWSSVTSAPNCAGPASQPSGTTRQ